MIRDIVRDPLLLAQKAQNATRADLSTANDLADTLRFNASRCVGMAANMIGVPKKIIVFDDEGTITEMFNPEILEKSGAYEAEEGCLSLSGVRKSTRYQEILVRWQTRAMKTQTRRFSGWTAQIIQHEVDHLSGILI